MKPTAKVANRFLALDCLTRMLFLPMLLVNRFHHLSCPNRWYDVARVDDIQGTGKANPELGV